MAQQTAPRSVEEELEVLWRTATEQETDAGGAPVSRVVLLTMVAWCLDQKSADSASSLIAAITPDHPSRAIIVNTDNTQEGGNLSARVSMSCQLVSRRDKQVCSEQVIIEAAGVETRKIINTILPLTLPDIPLELWLPDGFPDDMETFDRLIQVSDRVIVDSRAQIPDETYFQRIVTLTQQQTFAVVDMAWVALAPRRMSVAQQFDSDKWRCCLNEIDYIEVCCQNQNGGLCTSSLLFGGWLAERLQWRGLKPVNGEEFTFSTLTGKKLVIKPEKSGNSAVTSLKMRAASGFDFEMEFNDSAEEALLKAIAPGYQTQETRRMVMQVYPAHQVLHGGVDWPRRDAIYTQTLELVKMLLTPHS